MNSEFNHNTIFLVLVLINQTLFDILPDVFLWCIFAKLAIDVVTNFSFRYNNQFLRHCSTHFRFTMISFLSPSIRVVNVLNMSNALI